MSARGLSAVALGVLLLLSSSCTYSVHLTHTSDFSGMASYAQAKVIEAEVEDTTFLGLTGESAYVDEAFEALQDKCKQGRITGIQTRYSTSHGFMSWTNKVVMKGYCIENAVRATPTLP